MSVSNDSMLASLVKNKSSRSSFIKSPRETDDDSFWSQLDTELSRCRSSITLLRTPLLTIKLFVELAMNEAFTILASIVKHPTTWLLVLPLIAASTVTSMYFIPGPYDTMFKACDVNSDGVLTPTEVAEAFRLPTSETSASLFKGKNNGKVYPTEFIAWLSEEDEDDLRSAIWDIPQNPWRETEYLLADVLWWFALGVVSSVGLGTGMHSGLLFLFPHILRICSSADACGNGNFWAYPTNIFYGPSRRTFDCIAASEDGGAAYGFWPRLLRTAPWAVIWGTGTALGEIPPYLLSYATAQDGGDDVENLSETSSFDIINRMQKLMLHMIKRWGFSAILLLAAWPNAAFDLCGMACGQFMMPFWTFFGATFVGKALIKVNLQTAFFVVLFSGDQIENLIQTAGAAISEVAPAMIEHRVTAGTEMLVRTIGRTRDNVKIHERHSPGTKHQQPEAERSMLQTAFSWFVVVMVAWFAKSVVDTFAQKRQEVKDDHLRETLRSRITEVTTTEEKQSILRKIRSEFKAKKIFHQSVAAALLVLFVSFQFKVISLDLERALLTLQSLLNSE